MVTMSHICADPTGDTWVSLVEAHSLLVVILVIASVCNIPWFTLKPSV